MKTFEAMPGTVFAAYLQGNTLLPQHDVGISVLVTKAMVDTYVDPEIDGVALWKMETDLVAEDHVDRAVKTMRALHAQNNVDCDALSDDMIRPRVEGLIRRSLGTARDAVAGFAHNQLKDGVQIPFYGLDRELGKLLFSKDGSGQLLRNEGLALQALCRIAKAALFSESGQAAMREYRTDTLAIMNRFDPQFHTARIRVERQLGCLAAEQLQAALPQIEADTGIVVDDKALEIFLYMQHM